MGGMKISELDFLRLLPFFMRDDEAVIALSRSIDKLIGEPGKRLDTIRTWDKIDELNEAECDELAWELDIDWYDSGGMSLEEKRNTIKVAQQIKRKRGTKWAVERLISAYFGEGHVLEWNELEGTPYNTPYTFIVLIEAAETTPENFAKFIEAANAAKNARSHIAGIFSLWQQGADPGVEYALGTGLHRYEIEQCGTRYNPASVGMLAKNSIETEPAGEAYLYSIPQTGELTCGTYPPFDKVEVDVEAVAGIAIAGKAIAGS
jgi:phage tail P2-like protein